MLNSNNTSGVPGLRARLSSDGQRIVKVDTHWYDGGRLRSTSYSVTAHGPIGACTLAMARRQDEGCPTYDITPRQAWLRLRRSAEVTGATRP